MEEVKEDCLEHESETSTEYHAKTHPMTTVAVVDPGGNPTKVTHPIRNKKSIRTNTVLPMRLLPTSATIKKPVLVNAGGGGVNLDCSWRERTKTNWHLPMPTGSLNEVADVPALLCTKSGFRRQSVRNA
jgi:hypothetical protein